MTPEVVQEIPAPPPTSSPMPMEIDLYDEISLWSVRGIVSQLRAAPDAPVTLRINSPGGDVQEGFALASALRTHRGRKIAVVEGVCASAATFPACACDELHMHPESLLMIHNPWGGTAGSADDMESYADVLRKMTDLMVGMYQRKTGADEETVRDWLSRDTWMTPQEAQSAGFCDAIVSSEATPAAKSRLRRFMAKLKAPPALSKRITAMKDQLRNKLAKHGLAEDDGNMMDAYLSYLAETEDGPDERKAMAAAMEEEKQARAKAEDDEKKKKEEEEAKASQRAEHEEPDGDEVKNAIKALNRKVAAHEEKQAMMARELADTKKELVDARTTIKNAAELSNEAAEAKALDWAKSQISMGRVRADHKGKLEDTAKWLAGKYRKDRAEAEDLLSAEGTFQFSERAALQRLTVGGTGIDQPIPREDELAAAGNSTKALDERMNRAITMQSQKLKAAGKPAGYDAAMAEIKRTDRALYDAYMGRN